MTTATIHVPGLKATVPLAAAALPRDPVPPDGPVEGGAPTVRAGLDGGNDRKPLEQVAEHRTGRVAVAPQGVLRPPTTPRGPVVLEGDGFQAVVKPSPVQPAAGERPRGVGRGDSR